MKLEDSKAINYITTLENADDCDFSKIEKILQQEFIGYNILVVDADEISDEEKEEFIVNCIQNKYLVDFQSGIYGTKDDELYIKIIVMLTNKKEN